MNGLRAAILSLFGLTVAIAAALVVLPIASLLDPVTRQAGAAFAHFAFFSLADSDLAKIARYRRRCTGAFRLDGRYRGLRPSAGVDGSDRRRRAGAFALLVCRRNRLHRGACALGRARRFRQREGGQRQPLGAAFRVRLLLDRRGVRLRVLAPRWSRSRRAWREEGLTDCEISSRRGENPRTSRLRCVVAMRGPALYGPPAAAVRRAGFGASPSGKAADFDSAMRRFKSSRPSHAFPEFETGCRLRS